uniref:Uncharacterized protein n=1 Tax=Aegilops tauschii TaxID=37682 RepID=M8ATY3_AEGTA
MWAWRSFLGQPRHLLPSRLHPFRHGASQLTAILGRDDLLGSQGYASNSNSNSNGDPHTEANHQHQAAAVAKRHLYVVLDDHRDGHSIHKLDLADDDYLDGGTRRLPEPPVLRVALPTVRDNVQFAAVGSSIVATSTSITTDLSWQEVSAGGVLIYDTKTAAQVVSPYLPNSLLDGLGYRVAITVGDRLYLLESCGHERYDKYVGHGKTIFASGLHCLTAHAHGEDDDKLWNWQPMSASSQWRWSCKENLLMLPFEAHNILAYAVRAPLGAAPHDHEILVSARRWDVNNRVNTRKTFSFSTTSHEWTCLGDWWLPVLGHAHYDRGLDAWLGLAVDDGYLCAGNVLSAPSEWKHGRDKLFCLDEDAAAGWSHVDTKLVPVSSPEGGDSEYCLMERLRPEAEGNDRHKCLADSESCLLRLTSFCVERGEEGEPVVVTARRRARSYSVSRYNEYFESQAFWM